MNPSQGKNGKEGKRDPMRQFYRCDCGKARPKDQKHCHTCTLEKEKKRLWKKLDDAQDETVQCRIKIADFETEILSLTDQLDTQKTKEQHPYSLKVQPWNGTCSSDYLKKVIRAIAQNEIEGAVNISYKRRE